MPNVTIYIETSIRSPNTKKGVGMYVIEYGLQKNQRKIKACGILLKENTTREGIAVQTLAAAFSRLVKPCSNRVITLYAALFLKRIKELPKWKENGWNTAGGTPARNLEAWKQIDAAIQIHKIVFVKPAEEEEGNEWKAWMPYVVRKSVREYENGKIYYPVDKEKVLFARTGEGYKMLWKDTDL